MATLVSKSGPALKGAVSILGDKSISHRALMLAALAEGTSRIIGLSTGVDVKNTVTALRSLGVSCEERRGIWTITGVGSRGFRQPDAPLDFGNSATGARLMMGLVAAVPLKIALSGDESLRRRPMDRVLKPLIKMGATVIPGDVKTLPFILTGTENLAPLTYSLPVASAQVKSAILLAALKARGVTHITEPVATRDHTERLLALFGVPVREAIAPGGGKVITVEGPCEVQATEVWIPGDFSAAAFPLSAALLVPGSHLRIENVGLNPTRTGLLGILKQMGAKISVSRKVEKSGEPSGVITAGYSKLTAICTAAAEAPGLIDEFPILFVAAACAKGISTFRGLSELRLKESNRLEIMAQGLRACGVRVEKLGDDLKIYGLEGRIPGGVEIDSCLDHRVAMAFAILGLVTEAPITIKGEVTISTSFPGFVKVLEGLGANIGDVRL